MKKSSCHFEPEKGWMNDPNGLVFYKGIHHAFFQHNPYSTVWDTMHWGHAVSEDLLHWKELPIALYPDQPYENAGGCFSGSAIVKDDRLYLIYTSVSDKGQTQSVAWSDDGIHFTKYEHNPVIDSCPLGYKNFRDPKISFWNGRYHLVVGCGNSRSAKVLHFVSEDILHWEYLGVLYENANEAPCIECPDFFPLGDRYVLTYSRMGTKRHLPGQIFVIGDFDGIRLTNYHAERPEKGPDFYAAQTYCSPDGRRIMIGWMWNWKRTAPKGAVRAGAFTLPRELTLEEGHIRIRPIREALPLLTEDSPYIRKEKGRIFLWDGEKAAASYPEKDIQRLQLLEDCNSLEFFVNDGIESRSLYKAHFSS